MTSMRRHYVASTSVRRHVPTGLLGIWPPLGPPNILNLAPPPPPPPPPPIFLTFLRLCYPFAKSAFRQFRKLISKIMIPLKLQEPTFKAKNVVFNVEYAVGVCCCFTSMVNRHVLSGWSINLTILFMGKLRLPKR